MKYSVQIFPKYLIQKISCKKLFYKIISYYVDMCTRIQEVKPI